VIELRDYKFCKAKRINGRGEVIYLAVDEYVYIARGWPTTPQDDAGLLVNRRRFLLEEAVWQNIFIQLLLTHV
jgi:hypothetical protein